MLVTHRNPCSEEVSGRPLLTTPILHGHSLLRERRNMLPTEYDRRDDEKMDREYRAWLDAPLELGPVRVPWSALGDNEYHGFRHRATVNNPWMAEMNVGAEAAAPEKKDSVAGNEAEKEIRIHMRVGGGRSASASAREEENKNHDNDTNTAHRVCVTGLYYSSYSTFQLAKPRTIPAPAVFPNRTGLLGQFTTVHDLTPTTTWDGFGWAVRNDMLSHSLPSSIDRDNERLVLGIYATYFSSSHKKKPLEMIVTGLPKETFQTELQKLFDREGIRMRKVQIRVLYYVKRVKRVRFGEGVKTEEEEEERRDLDMEERMRAWRTKWNPEPVFGPEGWNLGDEDEEEG